MTLVLAAFTAVASELAGIGLTATAAWLIVRAAEQPPIAALTVAIVIVRTLAIARGSLRYAERLTGHAAVLRILADLRSRVYAALVRRNDIREGDALTRVVSDVDAYQDALLRCVIPAAVAMAVGVIGLAVTAVVSLPAFLALACGLVLMGLVLPWVSARLATRAARQGVAARARLADHMVDLVHGEPELTVYGATEDKLREADAVVQQLAAVERRTIPLGALSLIVHIGTVMAVLTLAEASAPATAALTLGVLTGLEVFFPLTSAAARWMEVRPAMARVRDLLTGPATAERPAPEVHLVLDRHIAVVGPSGAGKSTLLAAIARRHPTAIGAMADAHIFHTTIRANLAFARPDITQDDLDAVAILVRLDDWLRTLPAGWDTVVSGETISGGQRQRLILARALLADADVLLLDEPVEGLDPVQGDQILTDVLATRQAVVLVTHRLSQVESFEDIVVLEHGTVTQRGSHADLAGRPGYYRDSWLAEKMISAPGLQSRT
jgi:ATP-binding cassette subfamily C protein CydC